MPPGAPESERTIADAIRFIMEDWSALLKDKQHTFIEGAPMTGMVGKFKLLKGGKGAAPAVAKSGETVAQKAESLDEFIRMIYDKQRPLLGQYDDLHGEMAKRAAKGFGDEVGHLESQAAAIMDQINALDREILEASKSFGQKVFK